MYCWLHFQLVVPRGRVGETATARHSASGARLPDTASSQVWAPGLRIWKPGRLSLLLLAEGAESPLAGHRTALCCYCLIPSHSREAEFLLLGIAKLLPQIVPVKRETLQVVSLTMTGLVRG